MHCQERNIQILKITTGTMCVQHKAKEANSCQFIEFYFKNQVSFMDRKCKLVINSDIF